MLIVRKILIWCGISVFFNVTFYPAIMMAAEKELPASQDISSTSTGTIMSTSTGTNASAIGRWIAQKNVEEPALSVNEPMYFVLGKEGGDTDARFQLSVKYRLFEDDGDVVRHAPFLERLTVAYTQTTLWNLEANTDKMQTNFRPSLFWEFRKPQQIGVLPSFLRFGYEHESNGESEEKHRGIDTVFIFPAWKTQVWGRDLFAGVKLYDYLRKDDNNSDIEKYRGYWDVYARYGNEDSWLVDGIWRWGTGNHNMVQLDISYPLAKGILSRTGLYLYVQGFYGYGETLYRYNEKTDACVKFGLAVVR